MVQIQESEYEAILRQAVAVIDRTRAMVATTVCSAIGTTHWEIGKLLHDRKVESRHGSGVVNRLSYDLKQRYPQMGVSPRNLWDMKKFYERFCDSGPKLRQAVAVLPWGHILTLMRKFGEDDNAILYFKMRLPVRNNKIDFAFIDKFMAELEAERLAEPEAYLSVAGFKDYKLTDEEQKALNDYDKIEWTEYNLEKLFGKSTRGKRLKSEDRLPGDLPFVTAGEAEEGVSAFIGNHVTIFNENTTTIDMFGSAKYRNYKYGGDDHVAIVHTENVPKYAAIFITSAIHKASHCGKFDYSKNFYARMQTAIHQFTVCQW